MFNIIINAMELPALTSQQFAVFLPVGLVVIFAVLVFAFGFKSSVEPPSFKHISVTSDDRKNTKKKKSKDKKPQTNGHAVVIDLQDAKSKTESVKPTKIAKPVETPKQKKAVDVEKPQDKKQDVQKSPIKKEKKAGKENENKNKKNNLVIEKPADFDEGEWEIAPSRKDKKNKKRDDPDVLPTYSPEKVAKKKGINANKRENEKVTIIDSKPMETLRIEDIMPQLKHDAAQAVASVIAESNFESTTTAVAAPSAVIAATPNAVVAPAPSAVIAPKVSTVVQAAAVAVEDVSEEQAVKKKKAKKSKSVSETETVEPAEVVVTTPVAAEATKVEPVNESGLVFNELEDAWKEAPQKKSKKKVRKD